MPYDRQKRQGSFVPVGSDKTLTYRFIDWKALGDSKSDRHYINEKKLHDVDFGRIEVSSSTSDVVQFYTIWGPIIDWNDLERILETDFGDEGSPVLVLWFEENA